MQAQATATRAHTWAQIRDLVAVEKSKEEEKNKPRPSLWDLSLAEGPPQPKRKARPKKKC